MAPVPYRPVLHSHSGPSRGTAPTRRTDRGSQAHGLRPPVTALIHLIKRYRLGALDSLLVDALLEQATLGNRCQLLVCLTFLVQGFLQFVGKLVHA
jgi:hypothetical protein